MVSSRAKMGEHSNPLTIVIPSEDNSHCTVRKSISEAEAVSDLQALDDRTELFGGDGCSEEQIFQCKGQISTGNKSVDHNFDSRHWDVHNGHDLRARDRILLNSNKSDYIGVGNEDMKMQCRNCFYPVERGCSETMVKSDIMWLQHHKSCELEEKLLENLPTTQAAIHTPPLSKSHNGFQPMELRLRGTDTVSCPNLQNAECDSDDESIKTALRELKESVNEISRSFSSKAKSLADETVISKEMYDDNSQFRHPSPLSLASNQNSRSPAICSHSGLSIKKPLTDRTDGIYSGDVTLSLGFESPTSFQLPDSVDSSNTAKDTNKDARGVDRENLRGCVGSIVVNKQERQMMLGDSALKPIETCLEYPDFSSKVETDEQVTSESSDEFDRNTREHAEEVLETETRVLESAGDLCDTTTSLDISVNSTDIQDLLNRMFQVLENLQNIFSTGHQPLCKGVCLKALKIVNFLRGSTSQDSITPICGATHNDGYREQNEAVHSSSSCMSSPSSSFLGKIKHTDLMNHTSTKVDAGKPVRSTTCQQTWPPRTTLPQCLVDLRPRETLNGRIKRVVCELYCEIQPLEDGIKEKALAMLEEMHRIVESLQVYEQSEDFFSSNETPSNDGPREMALNIRASCFDPSSHSSQDKCNDCTIKNEQYNELDKFSRQKNPDCGSSCSPVTQSVTNSLSIENIRGRIKSLIQRHSDLTPEETNKKLLSILSDMEKVLDTLGDQKPSMSTRSPMEGGKAMRANKTTEPEHSQLLASPKVPILMEKLEEVIHGMRPDLQIADCDPQSKLCFLLNVLTEELHFERSELSSLEDVGDLLKSLDSELCLIGAGNSILATCIREMIEVVTIVADNLACNAKSQCKSKALTSDTTCAKSKEKVENGCKTGPIKGTICDKLSKKWNNKCLSETKVIEELFVDSGEKCETIPCETVKMATATCDTLQAEEKHVCKSKPLCVRKREASTERLQSYQSMEEEEGGEEGEENKAIQSPCSSNGKKVESLVMTEDRFTASNRCCSEVVLNLTEPVTGSTESTESLVAQILGKLQDLIKTLEMEESTLQQCTIVSILEAFSQIETTLASDPQYATILREAKKILNCKNGGKEEAQPCLGREGSCSRWRRISRRHRNRSNSFASQ